MLFLLLWGPVISLCHTKTVKQYHGKLWGPVSSCHSLLALLGHHGLISNQFWLTTLHHPPARAQHCKSVKLSHQLQSVQELLPLNTSLSFIHKRHLPWNHKCKTQPGSSREPPQVVQLVHPQCCRKEFGFENTDLPILLSNCEPIPWRFSSLGTNTAWKCFPLWPIIEQGQINHWGGI